MKLESFPHSPTAQRMLSYISPVYDESYVGKYLFEAMGGQWDEVQRILDEVRLQAWPETATWGLIWWEQRYGLDTDLGLDMEVRRHRILTKRGIRPPMNPARMELILQGVTGDGVDVTVQERTGDYAFTVFVEPEEDIAVNYAELTSTVRQLKQSHLSFIVWAVYRYILEHDLRQEMTRFETGFGYNYGWGGELINWDGTALFDGEYSFGRQSVFLDVPTQFEMRLESGVYEEQFGAADFWTVQHKTLILPRHQHTMFAMAYNYKLGGKIIRWNGRIKFNGQHKFRPETVFIEVPMCFEMHAGSGVYKAQFDAADIWTAACENTVAPEHTHTIFELDFNYRLGSSIIHFDGRTYFDGTYNFGPESVLSNMPTYFAVGPVEAACAVSCGAAMQSNFALAVNPQMGMRTALTLTCEVKHERESGAVIGFAYRHTLNHEVIIQSSSAVAVEVQADTNLALGLTYGMQQAGACAQDIRLAYRHAVTLGAGTQTGSAVAHKVRLHTANFKMNLVCDVQHTGESAEVICLDYRHAHAVEGFIIKDTMWYFDGSYPFDGTQKFNADIIRSEL